MDRKKILIVDDEKSNIDIIISLLKDDYDLIPALNGEKGLAILERLNIDLVLLDIIMPDMDGYEVCKRIRSNSATAHLPVIFVTAKNDQESIDRAHEVGGMDVIQKPFSKDDALEIIKAVF